MFFLGFEIDRKQMFEKVLICEHNLMKVSSEKLLV